MSAGGIHSARLSLFMVGKFSDTVRTRSSAGESGSPSTSGGDSGRGRRDRRAGSCYIGLMRNF